MGFRYKAHIQFDQMTLSDEAAEKNLLIQLADRDIISHETLLERFKEIPQIENIRIKREISKRDSAGPPKASPYHNPNHDQDIEKMDKQGQINLKQEKEKQKSVKRNTNTDIKDNGRPPNSLDNGPRKKRVEKPKSQPGLAETLVWAENSWSKISDTVNNAFLNSHNKKNLRQLTKAQVKDLESIKLDVFTNFDTHESVNPTTIFKKLKSGVKTDKELKKIMFENNINLDNMSIDDYRTYVIGLIVDTKTG